MMILKSSFAFSCLLFLATCITASGHAVADPENVACSASNKLQAKIDAVPAGEETAFNVSGTCTENLVVPYGKSITIKAANASAKIVAAKSTFPALMSIGDTTIEGMTVLNQSGVADSLIEVSRGGYLQLLAAKLSAPKASNVVSFSEHSAGRISNSSITGGTEDAVTVWDGSSLVIVATPEDVAGSSGYKSVIASPSGFAAITCGVGSSLRIRAKSTGSSGSVLINNSTTGIYANECSLQLDNDTSQMANFVISGASKDGYAIQANKSSVQVSKVTFSDNSGWAIDARLSSVQIDGSSFLNNKAGDIGSTYGSNVNLSGWTKLNSLPSAFVANTMKCWPSDGARIFVEANSVSIPSGKSLSDLTDKNPCVSAEN